MSTSDTKEGRYIRPQGLGLSAMALAFAIVLFLPRWAAATDSPTQIDESRQVDAVGHPLGARVQSGLTPNSRQVLSQVLLTVLGVGIQALTASANPPNTIDGVTYTEFYAFGKRVLDQSFHWSANSNGVTAGLAPAEIRVPVVLYPIGPVLLQVDGGARFQADLKANLVPVIGIPIELSSLGVQLETQAAAAGFIEGYAKFLVVRGGVGGQVDLMDGQADVNARFSFDGSPPYAHVSAMVEFLKGRFYAFLDYFSLAKFGWKRLLNHDLYRWKGFCFATEALRCPGN